MHRQGNELRLHCRQHDAGAQFLVSPHLSLELQRLAYEAALPYVPGVATPTEAVHAIEAGASLVKLFPIRELGGVPFLRALRGPLPDLAAMVTGGVRSDQIIEYLDAGAVLVGAGSLFGTEESETRERVDRVMNALEGRTSSAEVSTDGS